VCETSTEDGYLLLALHTAGMPDALCSRAVDLPPTLDYP
jgi:hypothetical protein